jgi:hypothetical protein
VRPDEYIQSITNFLATKMACWRNLKWRYWSEYIKENGNKLKNREKCLPGIVSMHIIHATFP